METHSMHIVITGGAGLVGQNLVTLLREHGYEKLTVIDKQPHNLAILQQRHPEVETLEYDLSQPGNWQKSIAEAEVIIHLQAQISSLSAEDFQRNTLRSTEQILAAIPADRSPRIIHISSSVVNSLAIDPYTESKKAQEQLIVQSRFDTTILRPTLMFGWFDRKHLGWLARLMRKSPVFPIPGHGRYMRQPLYARDFCRIILSCIEQSPPQKTYNITGLEKIDYIDLIRLLRQVIGARTCLLKIPLPLFHLLLRTASLFMANPPFTGKQLDALCTPDEFEVIDWPALFNVPATPLQTALEETFHDPRFSSIEMEF